MSDRFVGEKRFTKLQVEELKERQNYICYICGMALRDYGGDFSTSIDHVVPKAISKWAIDLDDEDKCKLADILNDERNCLVAHKGCNRSKSTRILTDEMIDSTFLSEELKQGAKDIIKEAEPYISSYKELFHEIATSQRFQCGFCSQPVATTNATIRRIDTSKPRSKENGVIVHNGCCDKYSVWKRMFNLW